MQFSMILAVLRLPYPLRTSNNQFPDTAMIRILLTFLLISSLSLPGFCQKNNVKPASENSVSRSKRPFKILTSGRSITIKSTSNLKNIMIWTSQGNRVVEQKDIRQPQFTYNATIRENIFFILVEMESGERFTERVGI